MSVHSVFDIGAIPWWAACGISFGVAAGAWRLGQLRFDGALAAAVVGALALRVHLSWAAYLVLWFVLASAVSRIGRHRKAHRMSSIIEKHAHRDAQQVLANGGVFAALAALVLWQSHDSAPVVGALSVVAVTVAAAGALAAAGADTFATEVGALREARPWSLRTWNRVAAGTSGAVSLPGTLATVVGAVVIAAMAWVAGMIDRNHVAAVAVGAVSGSLIDTMLGAWVQERRWCDHCESATERQVHSCGTPTERQHGVPGVNNDVVNVLCTIGGAAVATLVAR